MPAEVNTYSLEVGGEATAPIPIDIYPARAESNRLVVFVGGSSDTKDDWAGIINLIQETDPTLSCASFTFAERLSDEPLPLSQQTADLRGVIDFLVADNSKEIVLVATSMGFCSASQILHDPKYSQSIRQVILLDPADYPLEADHQLSDQAHTWSGADEFDHPPDLFSDLLPQVSGNYQVDVVHFCLRNYGPDGYIDKQYTNRGRDHSDGFPRLNRAMIRSIYDKLPPDNQGQWLEVDGLPHGINRDGNIAQNIHQISTLLSRLLQRA